MLVDCPICVAGTLEGGGTCTICSGAGEIDLTDTSFKFVRASHRRLLEGVIWDSMITSLADILDKCNDIKEKVDEIKRSR